MLFLLKKIKKKDAAKENARLKAKYRKIMNESEGARKVGGMKVLSKLVVKRETEEAVIVKRLRFIKRLFMVSTLHTTSVPRIGVIIRRRIHVISKITRRLYTILMSRTIIVVRKDAIIRRRRLIILKCKKRISLI
jgi:hypothetical protein